ncbi:hypothetical protein CSUI_008661 [Cystoisospora suis]|uniref:Uncharacterized protein n=1 Tax=Cystoisospora suis TaxID=483139 RepID=A0A2C6KMA5_9APIC|nr:hypothetical protein CSUI_008661 [Cystoisospora suis]
MVAWNAAVEHSQEVPLREGSAHSWGIQTSLLESRAGSFDEMLPRVSGSACVLTYSTRVAIQASDRGVRSPTSVLSLSNGHHIVEAL